MDAVKKKRLAAVHESNQFIEAAMTTSNTNTISFLIIFSVLVLYTALSFAKMQIVHVRACNVICVTIICKDMCYQQSTNTFEYTSYIQILNQSNINYRFYFISRACSSAHGSITGIVTIPIQVLVHVVSHVSPKFNTVLMYQCTS